MFFFYIATEKQQKIKFWRKERYLRLFFILNEKAHMSLLKNNSVWIYKNSLHSARYSKPHETTKRERIPVVIRISSLDHPLRCKTSEK